MLKFYNRQHISPLELNPVPVCTLTVISAKLCIHMRTYNQSVVYTPPFYYMCYMFCPSHLILHDLIVLRQDVKLLRSSTLNKIDGRIYKTKFCSCMYELRSYYSIKQPVLIHWTLIGKCGTVWQKSQNDGRKRQRKWTEMTDDYEVRERKSNKTVKSTRRGKRRGKSMFIRNFMIYIITKNNKTLTIPRVSSPLYWLEMCRNQIFIKPQFLCCSTARTRTLGLGYV